MLDYNKIELSILNQTEKDTKKILEKEKNIKYIHIDIMDGYFVKNLSNINPFFLKELNLNNYSLHLHFMVENVEIYYNYFKFLNNIKYISFHIESNFYRDKNLLNFIKNLKEKKIEIGLAINPDTKIDSLNKTLIKNFDFFLIMTVIPGLGGQKFISNMEEKIKYFKKKLNKKIFIDGGVNEKIYNKLENIADQFIIGSYLYKKILGQKK